MPATYTDLKVSDEKWLGQIPRVWPRKHLRYLFRPSKQVVGSDAHNFELLSLTRRGVIPRSQVEGGKNPENYDTYQVVEPNDLLVCLFDYDVTPRTVGEVTRKGMVTGAYTVLKPISKIHSRFYYYFLLSLDETKELLHLCTGLRNGLSKPVFFGLNVPVPDLNIQKKIVDYLDSETAKIDELIVTQEKLIELLDEKLRASITYAVTHGIDSKIEFTDSNSDWIGKIPKHWKVKKIKYLFKIQKRIIGVEGPDVLSITQSGIKKKDILSGEGQLAQDYSKYQIVERGDFAMNHMDLITGYVDISPYDGVTSPDYRVFTIMQDDYVKRYFLYIFQQCYKSKIFFPLGQGSAQLGRWRLPAEAFNNFTLPVPPVLEQAAIVDFLDEQVIKVNQLRSSIQKQILLLKERRTSLIRHTVTGKIKV